MKFLTIDGKIQAQNGKPILVPDTYNNELIKLNGNLVKTKTNLIGHVKNSSDTSIVSKGDLINMNLDGTSRQYRVLKCDKNVAMVMGMWDDMKGTFNDESTTTTFGSFVEQKYEGSTLDTYLNTTWYNTLGAEAKAAIVPENVTQYCYSYYDEPSTPNTHTYTYQYQKKVTWSDSLYRNANNEGNVSVGNRNVFALDLKDIFDYFDKVCITSDELMTMFWNSTSQGSRAIWLRSAKARTTTNAWVVDRNDCTLYGSYNYAVNVVRPAFNIDLSKVSFTTVN